MSLFKLEYKSVELKLWHVFTIARGSKPTVENVFIRMQANGITGNGEAAPNRRYNEDATKVISFLESIPDRFFDDIRTPAELADKLDHWSSSDSSGKQIKSARAAVEMAWLDWWGKEQQIPLWKLWEASSNTGPITSFTIGLDELDLMQQKVEEAAEFPILKVKLGTDRDRQIIEAIREVTDKPLRVDANEGWQTLAEAREVVKFLADQNIEMIEQPMPTDCFEEMIQLKEYSPIPLCADESFEGEEELESISRAFDIINIKLMKIGSVVRAKDLIERAKEAGLEVMIGCMIESSLAISAGALLSLWADYADLDGHLLIENDPFKGLELDEDNQVRLNNAPGLGVKRVGRF